MEKSVLLGTKPLVDSIRHFIRDPSGVFSVRHLCECRIVQWSHDSRLLLLLNWFLHIIKRTLHNLARRYEFYVLVARTISHEWAKRTSEILFLPLEHKIHIFSPPCNILYISSHFFFRLNTLQGTPKAPSVDLLRLNDLRGAKTSFLTPKRYNEHPDIF